VSARRRRLGREATRGAGRRWSLWSSCGGRPAGRRPRGNGRGWGSLSESRLRRWERPFGRRRRARLGSCMFIFTCSYSHVRMFIFTCSFSQHAHISRPLSASAMREAVAHASVNTGPGATPAGPGWAARQDYVQVAAAVCRHHCFLPCRLFLAAS
jgi:hypothetical protein